MFSNMLKNDEEFVKRWNRLSSYQRKFCLEYLKTFDIHEAALAAGYTGVMLSNPLPRVYRKVRDVCAYLIAKHDLLNSIVRPEWVLKQYKKLYDNSTSEISKIKILENLSKIIQLQSDAPKINIENNLPTNPVQITFTKD